MAYLISTEDNQNSWMINNSLAKCLAEIMKKETDNNDVLGKFEQSIFVGGLTFKNEFEDNLNLEKNIIKILFKISSQIVGGEHDDKPCINDQIKARFKELAGILEKYTKNS